MAPSLVLPMFCGKAYGLPVFEFYKPCHERLDQCDETSPMAVGAKRAPTRSTDPD